MESKDNVNIPLEDNISHHPEEVGDGGKSSSSAASPSASPSASKNSFEMCGVTRKTAIAARIILFIFLVVVMTSLLLLIHNNQNNGEVPDADDLQQSPITVIKKSEWSLKAENATKANKSGRNESIPERVYVNGTSTKSCRAVSECFQLLQTIEMESSDFECNFFISETGMVFEDSGWTNSKRIFISFIGNKNTIPSTASLKALDFLLESGISTSKLDRNYKIVANKSFLLLWGEIQKSLHWSPLDHWLSD